jgi:hypothetical protein
MIIRIMQLFMLLCSVLYDQSQHKYFEFILPPKKLKNPSKKIYKPLKKGVNLF